MVNNALEVEVVLVRSGTLDEATVIAGELLQKGENDPSNGTVFLLPQGQSLEMLLPLRQSPRLLLLLLLQSFLAPLQ